MSTKPLSLIDLDIVKHDGLIHTIINREFRKYNNDEDVFQRGRYGVYKALMKYDKTRGTTFSTYAGYFIRNEIKGYLSKEKRYTARYFPWSNINADTKDFENIPDNSSVKNQQRLRIATLIKLLPNSWHRRIVIDHYIYNKTYQEIAVEYKCTAQNIQQTCDRSLTAIKRRVENLKRKQSREKNHSI